jgi:branched-chain amino acid transport system permease protein
MARSYATTVGKVLESGYAGLGVLVLALMIAPFGFANNYHYDIATKMSLNAIVAVGLNLLIGYAGQISLGHAAFFAIGGYSSAILPSRYGVHGVLALIAGAALAGVLAFVVARPILRLRGHYLAMGTLGLGIIVAIVINREIEFTGGPDGISVPALDLLGWKLRGPQTWYWIVAGALVCVVLLSLNLMHSAFGRGLRALADSEIAAQSAGIDTATLKVRVFVLSAVIAAVSGSLFANAERFITPDEAGFLRSVEFVTMVVVGGTASTFGAAIGAAMLTALPQALSGFEQWHDLLFGIVLVATMIFLPRGVVPSIHLRFAARRRFGQEPAAVS